MDDIQKRLEDNSKECLEAFKNWDSDKKNEEKRERLMAGIHELRKVCSRVEIELAVSERNEQAKKPIPIPSHRASHKKKGDNNDEDTALPDFIKNNDNGNGGQKKPRAPKRAPRAKKAED